MDNLQRFSWTDRAKNELLSIVDTKDQALRLDWSDVANTFKQVYPNYHGNPNSLRVQYCRMTIKSTTTQEQSDQLAQKFRWSEEAKQYLLSLVDKGDQLNKKDWSVVANNFKETYPNYQGKTDALRIQYSRMTVKHATIQEISDDFTEKFRWSEEAKQYLLSLVNAENQSDVKNWSVVGENFKQAYPTYKGSNDAIRKQFYRFKSENNDQTTFVWSKTSKKDLMSILNDLDKRESINWAYVLSDFKKLYPHYKGSNDALRMQFSLANEHCGKSNDIFKWTKSDSTELSRLVNYISVDGYPNWTKIYYTFKKTHLDYEGTKRDLKTLYDKICNEDVYYDTVVETDKLNDWEESMDILLAQATGHAQYIRSAQIRDGRRKNVDNLAKLTVKIFKEFYKARRGTDYLGVDALILQKFYDYKQLQIPSSYLCDTDIDTVSNIDAKKYKAYSSKNHTLAFSKVFKECCHNCGFIFPRNRTSSNRKLLPNAIKGYPRVCEMRQFVGYIYSIDEKYITCPECHRLPNWFNEYNVAIKQGKIYKIPTELATLNEYEQNQIALCGGFYTLYRKQNVQCKVFEHRQGECNIGKKRDTDYHSVFTTYFNIERPHQLETSNDKIKTALRWLRKNNRLFIDFLSNYETIYGYLMSCHKLRPEERIIQISKGSLPDMVGKDKSGLFIPADNVQIEGNIRPESHKFGIQHPLQANLNKLRDIINVNYSDPDLEAKRWPHLFPEGNGSWRKNSSLRQQTYVKHRLLSIDGRFRRNTEFMFFWYDRLIKERLLYYNNQQRTVNVSELMESLHVRDVKENENRYGSTVPSSVSGSKSFWRARCLDLMALGRDLGTAHLFVTLTQNDNWLELQEVCGAISVEEMDILNRPIMQPAIGGKSIVNFPVETVVAFYKRLEMFMNSCIHNKTGPFGEVTDYWFRIEYQNRGALHCHMVLWICEDTIPDNVVMAEMPRYSGDNEELKNDSFLAREYVKTFQMHTCSLGNCKQDINSKCKYGFPYAVQMSDEMNESKMGYKYMRRSEEDSKVVPYNLYALMCWNGHINVQKVTPNGIEAYLCKYISKPERSIDIKDITSDTEKFLKARVVGILECCAHLLQFHQVGSSRKTIFLPCDFQPKQRMLKRKIHLPIDSESQDIYYQTLLYKYLVRPQELHNLTFVDMFRFYDVLFEKSMKVLTQSQLLEDESDQEFQPKIDETQYELSDRARKIRSQRICYISNGYKYVERGKAAVPRWRFLLPFGSESEKYYEQKLLLNVPIIYEDLNEEGYPFSKDNKSKTFVEECCIRGLVDSEETAKSALIGAVQRGFSVDRVLEIAKLFVDQSYVTRDYVDSIIIPWQESMPIVENSPDGDSEYGEELAKMLEMRVKYDPYETYLKSMTESQTNIMEWVDRKINKCDQIMAIISGGAGVGKSYITKALYSYFIEKKKVCILLATTGSAAHLISGTTVHYYLKVDIHGNKFLQPGTISAKIVEDTDVILLDEFSMLNSELLDQLNECTTNFGRDKSSLFGGKHVFLIGDPCQLPSIGTSVFSNPLLNAFSILLLKETVRQQDNCFAALLNRVRVNEMTDEDINLLKTRYTHVSNIEYDDETLIVTATRKKMHFYNSKFIEQLPGDQVKIVAQDFERDTNKEVSFSVKKNIRLYLKNLWDEELIIKEGCIVRLLRNLDVPTGWVNSKRAKVFRVAKDGGYIVLQDILEPSKQLPLTKIRQPFKLGANLYYRLQYPLILGYSTTVHAVQGTTVTGNYYVDLDRSFWESGQAFVALSRPKDFSQLFLLNTHFEKVYLKAYYKSLLEWMSDVDEISIMRKPRCHGDFPLIPKDEQNLSKMQAFPSFPAAEEKSADIKQSAYKAPRKVHKRETNIDVSVKNGDDSVQLEESKNKSCSESHDNAAIISSRILKLAKAFNNSLNSSSPAYNKIQFGFKLLDQCLEELNERLHIHSVTDPLIYAEAGHTVTQSMIQMWDEQMQLTLNLFETYLRHLKTEFEAFKVLVLGLNVSNYTGQTLDNNVPPMLRHKRLWQAVKIAGDGRCFYHSVSMNLFGNSTLSNSLKMLIAATICNDYDIYDSIFSSFGSSASNVLLKTLSYDCWADMDIIAAMSYTLQRPIIVVSGLQDLDDISERNFNPLESSSIPVMVGHVKMSTKSVIPNHFVALLKDDSYVPNTNSSDNSYQYPSINLPDSDVEMIDLCDSLTESL